MGASLISWIDNMKKPISKRDAHIKELRRIADYANGLAYDNGDKSATPDDAIERVLSFRELPGGDTYDSIHGELNAKGRIDQEKELELFHAKTVKAHHDLLLIIDQGQPTSHWIGPDEQPVDYTSVHVRKGKIGGKKYKIVKEISEDLKSKCFALAKAANDEADFISRISELDGDAEDEFFRLCDEEHKKTGSWKRAYINALDIAKENPRLAGMYERFENASYDKLRIARKRWNEKRP